RHRARYFTLLALSVAFSLFGGAPEGFVHVIVSTSLFFLFLLACRTRLFGGAGPIRRPAFDLILATLAGGALAAPFALPALQMSRASVRSLSSADVTLPAHELLYLPFQGFDGLPI